jgi:23S rRNA C2498 (ribose-2'-O)-methylase RlmM
MAISKKEQRRVIDKVFILLGAVTMAVLLAAGGIAWKGYSFATDQVKTELGSQKITFPPKGSPAIAALPAADQAQMNKYAGQLLENGDQAKVYANNFIAVHLSEVAGGKTYSEVSTAALANPSDAKLQAQKAVLFQGETLRGLLLSAGYSYWTMGMLARDVAIAFFVGAGVMALLVLVGLGRIARRV